MNVGGDDDAKNGCELRMRQDMIAYYSGTTVLLQWYQGGTVLLFNSQPVVVGAVFRRRFPFHYFPFCAFSLAGSTAKGNSFMRIK